MPLTDPIIQPIHDFIGAREALSPADRLQEVRIRSRQFREKMLSQKPVSYLFAFSLIGVPYPTKYGFLNALNLPTPLMQIVNKVIVVQFETILGLKTLLISPSDSTANAETPFFKRLTQPFGPFQKTGKQLMAPIFGTVEDCLAVTGLKPEDIDYISYDHLHTQDLRKWIGGDHPFFPKAKLLIMCQEWESIPGLLPHQRDWYCPHGIEGISPERLIVLEQDVMLGESVALLHTPGHTEGNHSFVTHTPEGLMVTSENGVSPESYAPLYSHIPGLRSYAKTTGMEVIMNGNTLDSSMDQYISMIQEKEIAGPSVRNPYFPNILCSSELAAYWPFPGVKPTFRFGNVEFGKPSKRSR